MACASSSGAGANALKAAASSVDVALYAGLSTQVSLVAEARAKRAIPVLFTPVMRRRFDKDGKFYDTHGAYPDLTRTVAALPPVRGPPLGSGTRTYLTTARLRL